MAITLIPSLQEAFGLSEAQVMHLIARSPYSYKIYAIPKKSGGQRIIAQPAKETKYIQHWLIDNVFSRLPIHQCATAYRTGASIKLNAAAHQNSKYLSKFDFKNFFVSIGEVDLINHFIRHLGSDFSVVDLARISRLSCIRSKDTKRLTLSIGAPSSPILSNSIMFGFDEQVHQWCKELNIVYTRYADDLAFSTNTKAVCSEIEPMILKVLKGLGYPTLILNEEKTIHLSKKFQRRITGVVINNQDELSIGRERKRAISALIHRYSLGILPADEVHSLQGMLGFARDIEPQFVFSMRKKYTSKLIGEILQVRSKKADGVK
jgi:RNA-directed DNA polymerase